MCYSCESADMRGRERTPRLLGRFGNEVDREGGCGGWDGGNSVLPVGGEPQ